MTFSKNNEIAFIKKKRSVDTKYENDFVLFLAKLKNGAKEKTKIKIVE